MLYPKHYARVIRVEGEFIVVAPGRSARTERLHLRWRCGRGHTGGRGFDFCRGTVVKVYQRPQDGHPKFRRVGS